MFLAPLLLDHMKCARRVIGTTFIRYVQIRNTETPNKLKSSYEQVNQSV